MTRRPITAAELRAAADALDAIEATIRAMAAAGRPATDIARAVERHLPWTVRHMRAMGLPVRGVGKRGPGKTPKPRIVEIIAGLGRRHRHSARTAAA